MSLGVKLGDMLYFNPPGSKLQPDLKRLCVVVGFTKAAHSQLRPRICYINREGNLKIITTTESLLRRIEDEKAANQST